MRKTIKKSGICLTCGSASLELAKEVSRILKIKLLPTEIKRFADGEIYIKYKDSFRGDDIFIIQSTCNPTNDNLMELLLMIDAAKRASAGTVNAVIPYFGYARQDRKDEPRVPISSKLVANLLTVSGVDRVITFDLHTGQLQGFFDIPLDHLTTKNLIQNYFRKKLKKKIEKKEVVVVSPDAGGVERARQFARELRLNIAIIDKRRPKQNLAEVMNIVGDIENKTAILYDDLIDTAGTITKSAKALIAKGATEVYAACSHPVFSGSALKKITESELKEVITTNTIILTEEGKKNKKIKVLSVAKLIAGACKCVHTGVSLKTLFEIN